MQITCFEWVKSPWTRSRAQWRQRSRRRRRRRRGYRRTVKTVRMLAVRLVRTVISDNNFNSFQLYFIEPKIYFAECLAINNNSNMAVATWQSYTSKCVRQIKNDVNNGQLLLLLLLLAFLWPSTYDTHLCERSYVNIVNRIFSMFRAVSKELKDIESLEAYLFLLLCICIFIYTHAHSGL